MTQATQHNQEVIVYRLESIDDTLERHDKRFDDIDERFDKLKSMVDKLFYIAIVIASAQGLGAGVQALGILTGAQPVTQVTATATP